MELRDKDENCKDFEYILKTIGTTGKLNIAIFIIASFSGFITAVNTFSYGFLGFTPPFWCYNDELSSNNWTMEQRRNISVPYVEGKFAGCQMYDIDYTALSDLPYSDARFKMDEYLEQNVSQKECSTREFNSTVATTVTEWDLVCERRVLYSTTQAVIQLGMLIGSGIVGFLTDRLGRKKMFSICTICISLLGFFTIFSPNVWMFIVLRLFSSVFGMGLYMSTFVLCVELSLPNQRSFTGNVFSVPWGLGVMILPGIAYLVRPWYYLQVALFIPTVFIYVGLWILPESPRWLITNGRYEEAYKILERISKSNKKHLPEKNKIMRTMIDINSMANAKNVEDQNKGTGQTIKDTLSRIAYIVVEPKFRKQSLIVFFCWFSVSIVYYGVSLGSPTPNEAGNPYLYMFLGGILEVVAYTVLWPISQYFGRKKTLFAFYAICSLSILSALLLITFAKSQAFIVLQWILFLVGKFAITSAFQLIWLFTAELYPTNYRSIAVGESSTVARAGSIFSSYINDLLVKKLPWAPAALFGSLSAMAAFCILLLPETTKENLPDCVPKSQNRGYDNPAAENIME